MADSTSEDYYTEHKKMLAGEPYTGGDPYLTLLRKHAQERVAEVAKHRHDPERYAPAICNLLGSVGDDKAIIESPTFFDYGKNTHVGKRFYMNSMCVLLDCARIDIGDDVMFGPSVQVYCAGHPTDPAARLTGLEFAHPVKIGNNVWVGGGAIIMPGVTIGNGVTIGAGAVVTKDVPDNVVVVGNPARIVKHV
ncbi:maltose O-acetyltransferase [Coemansia reversa NRRL 1564]|uniref:Maltose O-acetyltransferase n=1 Tax=Coemansia reversa (strain ATCC 12441 / NRRL 1564) TaxID=763665 RepID=A0A2G5B8T5_COERN|nr:maltose O-acetyltransferase [Coemansia reversa NRRL 1564]|eukprot:PIA15414.1 maltose O-acetyltransferase [Coemansia reversa NRRL 1564]